MPFQLKRCAREGSPEHVSRYGRRRRVASETSRGLERSMVFSRGVSGRRRTLALRVMAFLRPSPGSPSRASCHTPLSHVFGVNDLSGNYI